MRATRLLMFETFADGSRWWNSRTTGSACAQDTHGRGSVHSAAEKPRDGRCDTARVSFPLQRSGMKIRTRHGSPRNSCTAALRHPRLPRDSVECLFYTMPDFTRGLRRSSQPWLDIAIRSEPL